MDTNNYIILSLTIYKISSLSVGALSIYLGYKLFTMGIWGNAGNLNSKFGDIKIVLKNGAPGSFFVVLGTVIIVYTLLRGLNFKSEIILTPDKIIQQKEKPKL